MARGSIPAFGCFSDFPLTIQGSRLDLPIVVHAIAEGVDDFSVGIDMAQQEPLVPEREVGETIHVLDESVFADVVMSIDTGAAAAGDDKGGFQAVPGSSW